MGKVRWDENIGFYLGIVTVVIIGKYCLVPDMGTWELIELLFKGMIGW
jgi:hypothetical protein